MIWTVRDVYLSSISHMKDDWSCCRRKHEIRNLDHMFGYWNCRSKFDSTDQLSISAIICFFFIFPNQDDCNIMEDIGKWSNAFSSRHVQSRNVSSFFHISLSLSIIVTIKKSIWWTTFLDVSLCKFSWWNRDPEFTTASHFRMKQNWILHRFIRSVTQLVFPRRISSTIQCLRVHNIMFDLPHWYSLKEWKCLLFESRVIFWSDEIWNFMSKRRFHQDVSDVVVLEIEGVVKKVVHKRVELVQRERRTITRIRFTSDTRSEFFRKFRQTSFKRTDHLSVFGCILLNISGRKTQFDLCHIDQHDTLRKEFGLFFKKLM